MTHICVGNLTIIGPDNGLSPGRRQAIIRTNAGILLIEPLRTNFSEILFGIQTFSFKKLHLKMSSAKWRPFCLGLNVLTHWGLMMPYHRIHHGSWSALVQAVACHWFDALPLTTWTDAQLLSDKPLGTHFKEFSFEIKIFSFQKMRLKSQFTECRPFCSGLNGLNVNNTFPRTSLMKICPSGGSFISLCMWNVIIDSGWLGAE